MDIAFIAIAAVIGIALGFLITRFVTKTSATRAADEALAMKEKAENDANELLETAKLRAETMRKEAEIEAKDKALKYKQEVDADNKERLNEIRSAEKDRKSVV